MEGNNDVTETDPVELTQEIPMLNGYEYVSVVRKGQTPLNALLICAGTFVGSLLIGTLATSSTGSSTSNLTTTSTTFLVIQEGRRSAGLPPTITRPVQAVPGPSQDMPTTQVTQLPLAPPVTEIPMTTVEAPSPVEPIDGMIDDEDLAIELPPIIPPVEIGSPSTTGTPESPGTTNTSELPDSNEGDPSPGPTESTVPPDTSEDDTAPAEG